MEATSPDSGSATTDSSILEGHSSGSVGELLEAWSKAILDDHCNKRDFTAASTDRMSEAFRAKHDGLPTAWSRDEFLTNLQTHLKAMPDFQLQFLNISSDVDEDHGRATVYMFFRLTGLNNSLRRESVAVLQWERKQGDWLCIKHHGFRGPAGFD